MAPEDRELRDALEKAQAALKTTRAELERAKDDQKKLDRTEDELEAARRELAEAQERERSLADALEASKRESRPPTEFEAPLQPVAQLEFGGAAAENHTTELSSPPGPASPATAQKRLVTGCAGVLVIVGSVAALTANATFLGILLLIAGLTITIGALNARRV